MKNVGRDFLGEFTSKSVYRSYITKASHGSMMYSLAAKVHGSSLVKSRALTIISEQDH